MIGSFDLSILPQYGVGLPTMKATMLGVLESTTRFDTSDMKYPLSSCRTSMVRTSKGKILQARIYISSYFYGYEVVDPESRRVIYSSDIPYEFDLKDLVRDVSFNSERAFERLQAESSKNKSLSGGLLSWVKRKFTKLKENG